MDVMDVMGQSVDPFDVIDHHVTNLRTLWRGGVVRDLTESDAGYERAVAHLRGAVDALDFALRTVTDPDLTEQEVRERIEGVVRRTLNVMQESSKETHA